MQILRFGTAALLAVFIVGCGSVKKTKTATIKYTPERKSALSSVKPQSFAIQVNDRRPTEERDCVLDVKLSSIDPTFIFVTEKPAPDLLADGLKREFEFNGHQVPTDGTKADVLVTVGLKRFFASLSGRTKVAEIDADVAVVRAGATSPGAPFPVSGNTKKVYNGVFAVISADPSDELSAALGDFIHNLILDSRFLEPLQQ
jgi:ABC-type uncharacterized transport system auxiliary subunit